jgi:UDP-N-acetylglucosamine--N-acetylmuramyl-(pentapeptide) pyrophosphoryl-undecaprenol N-acetylglucosamine transferase
MQKQSYHNICFVAGRSGGHLLPALTLAQKHKKEYPDSRILFFSTGTPLDTALVKNRPCIDRYIQLNLENIPRSPLRMIGFSLRVFTSFCSSIWYLLRNKSKKVVSLGGYISIPVCLAARTLRIPVELYELNAVPGKATKFLAPFAKNIAICFEEAKNGLPQKKCTLTEYPIRFSPATKQIDHTDINNKLGFSSDRKTILILGGSQGSLFINRTVERWLEKNPSLLNKVQIIHQTGAQDKNDWKGSYKQHDIPAIVFDYCEQIEDYYTAADLIICRSGAGTLFEVAHFAKKCVTIPLEAATTDHQVDNAYAIAKRYPTLFTVIRESDFKHNQQLAFNQITKQIAP